MGVHPKLFCESRTRKTDTGGGHIFRRRGACRFCSGWTPYPDKQKTKEVRPPFFWMGPFSVKKTRPRIFLKFSKRLLIELFCREGLND